MKRGQGLGCRRGGMGRGQGAGQGAGRGRGGGQRFDQKRGGRPRSGIGERLHERFLSWTARGTEAVTEADERAPMSESDATVDVTTATAGERPVAVVDSEHCMMCGLCVDTCMQDAIEMGAELSIDNEKCTACGACVAACPNDAITISKRR